VRTWDVDRQDRLHPAAVFNYFQEIAGNHATALGMGRETLLKTGQIWILSRMTAIIEKRPGWGEKVKARTWPRGTERLFAIRDYDLLDSRGRILARGRSGWIIFDTVKMRPVRPEFLTEKIPLNEGNDAIPGGATGLKTYNNLAAAGSRTALYSDIDHNGHMNNSRYIQWIQDLLPASELEKADTFRLDINYLSEIKPGEGVDFYIAALRGERERPFYALEGRQREAGQVSFRAEVRTDIG